MNENKKKHTKQVEKKDCEKARMQKYNIFFLFLVKVRYDQYTKLYGVFYIAYRIRIWLWRQSKCLRKRTNRGKKIIEKKKQKNTCCTQHSIYVIRARARKKKNLADLQSLWSALWALERKEKKHKIFHLKAIKMCVYLTSTTVFF